MTEGLPNAAEPEKADPNLLSPAHIERIIRAFAEKLPNSGICKMCGKNDVIVSGHLVSPTIVEPGGGAIFGGVIYPAVQLICKNCGYTTLHNAIMLGVFDRIVGE